MRDDIAESKAGFTLTEARKQQLNRTGTVLLGILVCLATVGCSDSPSGGQNQVEPLGHPDSENIIVWAISSTGWKGLTRAEFRGLLNSRRREFEWTAIACLEAEGIACQSRFESPMTPKETERFETWLKGKEIERETFTDEGSMPVCVKFRHQLCGLIYFPFPDEVEAPEAAVDDPIQVNKLDNHWYAFEDDWN